MLSALLYSAGVDSSLPAISLANENLSLNGFQQQISFVRTDVDDFMREALDADRQWDIIILGERVCQHSNTDCHGCPSCSIPIYLSTENAGA